MDHPIIIINYMRSTFVCIYSFWSIVLIKSELESAHCHDRAQTNLPGMGFANRAFQLILASARVLFA